MAAVACLESASPDDEGVTEVVGKDDARPKKSTDAIPGVNFLRVPPLLPLPRMVVCAAEAIVVKDE